VRFGLNTFRPERVWDKISKNIVFFNPENEHYQKLIVDISSLLFMGKLKDVAVQTIKRWNADDGTSFSAALSFYLILSLPSLLLFSLSLGGMFLKVERLQSTITTKNISARMLIISNKLKIKTATNEEIRFLNNL